MMMKLFLSEHAVEVILDLLTYETEAVAGSPDKEVERDLRCTLDELLSASGKDADDRVLH